MRHSFLISYLVDDCVFKFVLVVCVENDTALVYKAHDWRDPAGAPQEVYDDVEKPVLDDEPVNVLTFSPSGTFY